MNDPKFEVVHIECNVENLVGRYYPTGGWAPELLQIPIDNRLQVLYGKNGAGKTRILQSLPSSQVTVKRAAPLPIMWRFWYRPKMSTHHPNFIDLCNRFANGITLDPEIGPSNFPLHDFSEVAEMVKLLEKETNSVEEILSPKYEDIVDQERVLAILATLVAGEESQYGFQKSPTSGPLAEKLIASIVEVLNAPLLTYGPSRIGYRILIGESPSTSSLLELMKANCSPTGQQPDTWLATGYRLGIGFWLSDYEPLRWSTNYVTTTPSPLFDDEIAGTSSESAGIPSGGPPGMLICAEDWAEGSSPETDAPFKFLVDSEPVTTEQIAIRIWRDFFKSPRLAEWLWDSELLRRGHTREEVEEAVLAMRQFFAPEPGIVRIPFTDDPAEFLYQVLEETNSEEDGPGYRFNDFWWIHFLFDDDSATDPAWALSELLAREANRIYQLLFLNAPRLTIEPEHLLSNNRNEPFVVRAVDESGTKVKLDQLSDAQRRWAEFTLQIICSEHDRQPILVLDEPEVGLHRSAERHLVKGLRKLADEMQMTIIVASHSPAFLRPEICRLHHVHRSPSGKIAISPMGDLESHRISELGLDPSDLLQHVRTVLLVEGEHEVWVLDELFGNEFNDSGVLVSPLRGGKMLKSSVDAQLLFRYTSANVLVMLDNESTERVETIWNEALVAKTEGGSDGAVAGILEKLSSVNTGEARYLKEFCTRAISMNERTRFGFQMMRKSDLDRYFPPSAFIRKKKFADVAARTWDDLDLMYNEWLRTNKPLAGGHKEWLRREFGASFTETNYRRAVRELDQIDSDFAALFTRVVQAS